MVNISMSTAADRTLLDQVKQRIHQLLKPRNLELIMEDNLPPLKWHLGHVIELQPGQH